MPVEIAASSASGRIASARTSAAQRSTRLPLASASPLRTTALTSTKQAAANESRSGVGLSVAFHSTEMPLATTASRNMTSATASGTAMIEKTSITTDCSVPMILSWLRNTPSAAPKAAPEKIQPNQP